MLKFEEDSSYLDSYDYEDIKKDIIIENEVFLKVSPQTYTNYKDLMVESPRICPICDEVFLNSFSYLQHSLSHISIPLIKLPTCPRCSKCFQTNSELTTHMETHTKQEKCNICYKLVSYKYIKTHIKSVHNTEMESCSMCSKIFKSPYTLKRHIMYVHDKVPGLWRFRSKKKLHQVECDICKKVLSDKHALKTHINGCHSTEAECDICGKKFTSKLYRNSHKLRVHDIDGKVHPCSECGRKCKSKRRLRIHKYNSHRES